VGTRGAQADARRLSTGDRDTTTAYTDIHRLFQRGELTAICKAALAEHGPMNISLAAKGLDSGDRVLAKSVAERLIHALAVAGKERGAIPWSTRG
jgi:hypothetical protein